MLILPPPLFIPSSEGIIQPGDVSGFHTWLDFSDDTTITLGTGDITQIDDKSGNGNHGTASGNGPGIDSAAKNDLDVAVFNGSTQFINLAGTYGTAHSFLLVGYVDWSGALPSNDVCPFFASIAPGGNTDGNAVFGYNTFNTSARLIGSEGGGSVQWLRKNGTTTLTYSEGDWFVLSYSVSGTTAKSNAKMGAFTDGFFDAPIKVGEFIAYDGVISNSDRNGLELFLSDKWDISLS